MSVIGIVTEKKKESELQQLLKNKLKELQKSHTIITINNNSIENVKNIKFEVIIIEYNIFGNSDVLKNILLKSDRLIVNADYEVNLEVIQNLKLVVITYGFNSKSTITASSINEDNIQICIQRGIKNLEGKIIEPQEIKIPKNKYFTDTYLSMIYIVFSLLYDKNWNFM